MSDINMIGNIMQKQLDAINKFHNPALTKYLNENQEFYDRIRNLMTDPFRDAISIANKLPKLPILEAVNGIYSPASNVLEKYSKSLDRFNNCIDWDTILTQPINLTHNFHADDSIIESWIDSASDIVDDMSEQEWIDETEEETIRSTFQDIKSTLLPAGKVIFYILNILSLISTITGCNLINAIEQFEQDSDKQVEVMPINNDDKKIIVAETELFNQISDALMFSDDTPEVRKD